MRNTKLVMNILWVLVVVLGVARLANTLFSLSISILLVVAAVAFALIHGAIRYRWSGVVTFLAICLVVSNILENTSILTGFPFGHYHYTDLANTKLFLVPWVVGPLYFSTGYLAWVLSIVLIGDVRRKGSWFTTFVVPFIASSFMVMWDLSFDPTSSTIQHLWIWEQGGGYFDSALFFRSEPGWIGADLETLCYVRTFQNGKLVAGLAMRTGLLRPMSRGTIRLRSSDPTEPPLLDPRLLSVDSDLRRLAIGVRESLNIAATAPMDQWIAGLDTTNHRHLGFSDGSLREDMDDDQMNAWLRANAEAFAHMAGGCRMGLDEDAVVDPQLRVHGLDGLRVVDISVLPVLVSGHPQAAVMAMAERASDLILDRPLERRDSERIEISSSAGSGAAD